MNKSIKNKLILFVIFFQFTLLCNNVVVSNVYLTNQNVTNHTTQIVFDISWDNSWRIASGAANWDAVWIFAKYRVGTGNWQHAYLSTTSGNHTVTTNNGVPAAFSVGTTTISSNQRGMGVFAYRSSNGTGSVNWSGVKLQWNYGENNVADTAIIDIKIYAIEMVYIPSGSFYVGDGTTNNIRGQLHNANSTTTPLLITSENSLTLGGTSDGNIGNNNASGMSVADDFNNSTTKTLPATFPKGYNAFYCMKYEMSQEQYMSFLNTLTRTQQNSLVSSNITGTTVTNRYVMSNTSSMSYRNGIRCDGTLPNTTDPVNFYCDYNGNGTGNESGDGLNIACNFINWVMGSAFADWSGLRPMTELEFEKVCRSNQTPMADDYAWGNTNLTIVNNNEITNQGFSNEVSTTAGANCTCGDPANVGAHRVGMFATNTTNREQSGASYFGVMEMSGSLWEEIVSIGISNGRSFTGTHGDGSLNTSGYATNSDWAGFAGSGVINAVGSGLRGGSFRVNCSYSRLSDRFYSSISSNQADGFRGMRFVRTAP